MGDAFVKGCVCCWDVAVVLVAAKFCVVLRFVIGSSLYMLYLSRLIQLFLHVLMYPQYMYNVYVKVVKFHIDNRVFYVSFV